MVLTPELLGGLAGTILSVSFAILPWFKTRFDRIPAEWKPITNVLVLLVAALGWLVVNCRGDWACIQANAGMALTAFGYAVVSNQTTFLVVIKQQKRKVARYQGDPLTQPVYPVGKGQ